MAATDARPVARKNQAFRIYFGLRQGDGSPIIGWNTPSGYLSKDGAAFANTTNTPTEITPANTGAGYLDLTATEMDCDGLVLKVATSDANMIPIILTLYPEESGDYRVDTVMVDGAPVELTTAAEIADNVWDESVADHRTAGSAGMALITASGNLISGDWATTGEPLTQAEIRSAVGLASANLDTQLGDIPTVSEFNARTLVAANYFDPTTDTVANVTTVATLTGHTPQTGDSYVVVTNIDDLVDTIDTEIGKIPKSDGAVSWNATALAAIQGEAEDALETYHLDHLLAVNYDPASKPGVSTALLNELVESDGGVSRFTANALEQAPGGGGGDATSANQTTIINHLTDIKGTGFSTSTDTLEDIRDAITTVDSEVGIIDTNVDTLIAGVNVTEVNGSPATEVSANDIADAVWDEQVSAHVTTGSAGDALIVASGNLIASAGGASAAEVWSYTGRTLTHLGPAAVSGDIASAVWDADKDDHNIADTFGLYAFRVYEDTNEMVTDLNNLITDIGTNGAGLTALPLNDLSQADIRTAVGLASANLDTQLGAIDTNVDTLIAGVNVTQVNGSSVNLVTASGIADQVWDEPLGEHLTVDSTGWAQGIIGSGVVDANVVQVSGDPVILSDANEIADAVWDETLSQHTNAGSTGQALVTASGNLISGDWATTGEPLTPSEVAGAVWNATRSSYVTGGSMGESISDMYDNIITNGVPIQAGGITSGTFGTGAITATAIAANAIGASELATDAVTEITGGVWGATMSSYDTPGTTGHALVVASGNLMGGGTGGATAAEVWQYTNRSLTALGAAAVSGQFADAIWDEQLGTHLTVGSAGELLGVAGSGIVDANIVQVNGLDVVDDGVVDANIVSVGTAASGDLQETVWNADAATYGGTGTYGQYIENIYTYTGTTTPNLIKATSGAIQDTLDNATYGLAALDTDLGTLITGVNVTEINGVAATFYSDDDIADAVWDEKMGDHVDAGSTGQALVTASGNLISGDWAVTGEPLTQAEIRSAVGLASANLDTQLTAIDNYVDTMEADLKTYGDSNWSSSSVASGDIAQAVWEHNSRTLSTQNWATAHDVSVEIDTWMSDAGMDDISNWPQASDIWAHGTRTLTNQNWVTPNELISVSGQLNSKIDLIDTNVDTLITGVNVTQVNGSSVNLVTASGIADQVWDEPLGEHLTVDSTGWAQGIIGSGIVDANVVEVSGDPVILSDANEIADAVWDEATADHRTAGSTGLALITASGNLISGDWATTGEPLTAAEIRSAVGLASANLDTQLGDIPTVSEFNARTLVAADYFDPAADTVANVTTVATLTGHTPQTGDSYAEVTNVTYGLSIIEGYVDCLPANFDTGVQNALSNYGAPAISDIATYHTNTQAFIKATSGALQDTLDNATYGLSALNTDLDTLITGVNVTQINGAAATVYTDDDIADAVWDEAVGDHVAAGSTGQALVTASGNLISGDWATTGEPLTQAEIRSAVGLASANLDSQLSTIDNYVDTMEADIKSYGDSNWSTATGFAVAGEPLTSTEVAQAVWNATMSTYDSAGTTGQALVTASGNLIGGASGPDAATIAAAVWDKTLGDHDTPGSTGHALVVASGNLISGDWAVTGEPLTAAEIRSAVGLASANLDTQLTAIDDYVDTMEADIKSYGDSNWATAVGFSTHSAADVWTAGGRSLSGTIGDFDALDTALDSAHGVGSWATATGFSTHSAADVWDVTYSFGFTTYGELVQDTNDIVRLVGSSGDIALAVWEERDQSPWAAGTMGAQVDSILADTDDLQTNQGDWATATGFSTHSAADVWTASGRSLSSAIADFDDLTASGVNLVAVNGVDVTTYTEQEIVDAVWDEPVADHQTLGTTGEALVASGVVTPADVWAYTSRTLSGTINDFDELDTALDSAHGAGSWATATGFSTHSAADVWTASGRSLSGTIGDFDALDTALDGAHGAGSWATATGFSTHSAADVAAIVGASGMIAQAVWEYAARTLSTQDWATNDSLITVSGVIENYLTDATYGLSALNTDLGTLITGVNVTEINGVAATFYSDADIADAVWDEKLSDHDGADSTGNALITASGNLISGDWAVTGEPLTQAEIRSAVGLASANLDTQLTAIDNYVDTMEADIKNYGDINWGTADLTTIGASGMIAQAVWEHNSRTLSTQNWATAHDVSVEIDTWMSDAGMDDIGNWPQASDIWTYGTRSLSTQDWSTHDAADVAAIIGSSGMIADRVDYVLTAAHGTGSWQDTLQASGDIAQAVWEHNSRTLSTQDWATSSELSAVDTKIDTIDTNVDTLITGVNVTQINGSAATVYTDDDIADAVWDETLSQHTNAGSTGQALVTASGNLIGSTEVQTSGIAYAVWEEPLGKHLTVDTAGWALGVVGSGIVNANMVQVSGEYVTLQNIQTGDIDTTGLATTTQLEYWALMILNNCGGGPVG